MPKVKSCEEIETLLTPFVDGEASGAERADVAAHLERCEPCRAAATAERDGRSMLRAHAARLRERAPQGLRDRCATLVAGALQPPVHRPRRFVMPVSMAATLVLALAGLLAVWVGTGPTVEAAHLTEDHWACFQSEPVQPVANLQVREDEWAASHGWRLRVPDTAPSEGLELKDIRRCWLAEGEVAHVMYRSQGHQVSLFVLPRSARVEPIAAIMRLELRAWTGGGKTYMLVAESASPDMDELVTYLRRAAR